MIHAVGIIAHNNTEVVKTAIKMLDDPRIVIILNIDRKSKYDVLDFIPENYANRLCILPRYAVNWGGYSLINCILRVFEAAVYEGADYIHILQGADLPLKTVEKMDSFFETHKGKNYLEFTPEREKFIDYKYRCKHFFVDNKFYRYSKILKGINKGIATAQLPFVNNKEKIYHGSSLFSITSDFAQYALEHEEMIRKKYRFALAGDEYFLHTLFKNSPYVDTLYTGKSFHLIDWARREGNSPHTFTMNDMEILSEAVIDPDIMFARKFDEKRDLGIVRKIEKLVL